MCGIVGIVSNQPVNQELYDALLVLQHRGQDAAGIVTCEGDRLNLRKDNGLARDVFDTKHMLKLRGNMGIAHVRYPTAGSSSSAEAQPFYVNSPYGITLAHNGNLTNSKEIEKELFAQDRRHINTDSDSEILLNVFAHELDEQVQSLTIEPDDVFRAVEKVHKRCRGGYAAVAMIPGFGVIAFRDPNGIRPAVFGTRESADGHPELMVASESVALDTLGFTRVRDIEPGEAVIFTMDGRLFHKQCAESPRRSPCLFEFVYFARPDSIIDDIFVHKARLRMGQMLAKKIQREMAGEQIDAIIPIPDTSRTSAMALAEEIGVRYAEGFIKNRYIGRTFIMPGQTTRKKSVRQKLNPIDIEFKGKNVLLVDDSIVRGTTSRQIVQMARDAGAKKVFFASAAPAVRYPNVYGIDMPAAKELIAHGRTDDQVGEWIGADRLIYQDLEDLIEAVQKKGKAYVDRFDTSVFDSDYVTGDVTPEYLQALEDARNDDAKSQRESSSRINIVGLHND